MAATNEPPDNKPAPPTEDEINEIAELIREKTPALRHFQGNMFDRDLEGHQEAYEFYRFQYATTSVPRSEASPSLILYPKGDDDIKLALMYAAAQKVSVAIRTGGHAYRGSSSTSGNNIQLDLSNTYRDEPKWEGNHFRIGVSWSIADFNERLRMESHNGKTGFFLPHGQCSGVHLGGHVQTGGYGLPARSFGLLSDYIVGFDIITADGNNRRVNKPQPGHHSEDQELFYAVFGGSPGNFGVLTHIIFEPLADEDYECRGFKAYYYDYDASRLPAILQKVAEMDNRPSEFDLCLTFSAIRAQSDSAEDFFQLAMAFIPSEDVEMIKMHRLTMLSSSKPFGDVLAIYAQWVKKRDSSASASQYDDTVETWFQEIQNAVSGDGLVVALCYHTSIAMSTLTGLWIFRGPRESPYPFEKRGYLTNLSGDELLSRKWPAWVASRIDALQSNFGCFLNMQIQNFGGEMSRFKLNSNQNTSFSWRDSTVGCSFDCFYDPTKPEFKAATLEWQKTNDSEAKPTDTCPKGKFADSDLRLLWAPYGNTNMNEVHPFYYEVGKYERLHQIKMTYDPEGLFSPNSFCIGHNL